MNLAFDGTFFGRFAAAAEMMGFVRQSLVETGAGPVEVWERVGDGPVVYVSAGIHGDEPAGPLAILEFLRAGEFGADCHWLLAPALNPEGLLAGTRENSAGVDLNRDYLRLGSAEIVAHVEWLRGRRLPDLFVSLHEDWETTGFYMYEINLGEDRPERTRAILRAVNSWLPTEEGRVVDGHEVRECGWIYHGPEADVPEGWPEAIFMAKLGCPLSYTFETPSASGLKERVEGHLAALRQAVAWQVGGGRVVPDT